MFSWKYLRKFNSSKNVYFWKKKKLSNKYPNQKLFFSLILLKAKKKKKKILPSSVSLKKLTKYQRGLFLSKQNLPMEENALAKVVTQIYKPVYSKRVTANYTCMFAALSWQLTKYGSRVPYYVFDRIFKLLESCYNKHV